MASTLCIVDGDETYTVNISDWTITNFVSSKRRNLNEKEKRLLAEIHVKYKDKNTIYYKKAMKFALGPKIENWKRL